MKKGGWDYYSSGADDEITLRENHLAFQRLWLKPRILRNVANIDFTTSFLGQKSSMPLYITATALGKLAHPDGELAITRAAHAAGVPYMLPTLSSYSLDEMIGEKAPEQVCFVQLYVNSDRKVRVYCSVQLLPPAHRLLDVVWLYCAACDMCIQVTEEYVQRAEAGGCKAVFVTVDAPQLGRREKDMRNKFADETTNVQDKGKVNKNQGTARMISAFIDPSLSWKVCSHQHYTAPHQHYSALLSTHQHCSAQPSTHQHCSALPSTHRHYSALPSTHQHHSALTGSHRQSAAPILL